MADVIGKICLKLGILGIPVMFLIMMSSIFIEGIATSSSFMWIELPIGMIVWIIGWIALGIIIQAKASAEKDDEKAEIQPSAYAKVLSVRVSGKWDSDDIRSIVMKQKLRFVTQENEVFTKEFSIDVRLRDIPKIKVGRAYSLRYDPDDIQTIMLDELVDPIEIEKDRLRYLKVVYGVSDDNIEMYKKAKQIMGVVMKAVATGNIVNDNAEMELVINVIKENGASFKHISKVNVPNEYLAYTIPGSVLPVYYDESKEKVVLWFYDASGRGGMISLCPVLTISV